MYVESAKQQQNVLLKQNSLKLAFHHLHVSRLCEGKQIFWGELYYHTTFCL